MAENTNMDGAIEKLLDRLITVIGDEARLFETFLELLEQQQQALISNDGEVLRSVTEQLHHVVTGSQELERERAEVINQLRPLRGAGEDLTITTICDMADAGRSSHLRSLRETILSLYSKIEETRMRNGLLVEQSVEQIRHTLEMIGRIPAGRGIYQKQGNVAREYAPLGINRRV